MNVKQMKFLKQFAELSRTDLVGEKELLAQMKAFAELDFQSAVDVWEYLTTDREDKIAADGKVAKIFADSVYKLLSAKNALKAVKAVTELGSVRRAAFQYSPSADSGSFFDIAVDFTVQGKAPLVDEILKCVAKNTAMKSEIGPYLKALVERVFIEILKKSPTKQISMSKKMTALLLSHIAKVKTEERPLLEQRIREIS